MNPFYVRRANLSYASKIKETANGRGRSARRKARKTIEVVAQRAVEKNGEIDEQKTTTRICEDETQKITDEKAQNLIAHCS
jgi:vacuolar-type H+-ATPase subunit H